MKVEDIAKANSLMVDLNNAEISNMRVIEAMGQIQDGIKAGNAYISASLLDHICLDSKDLLKLFNKAHNKLVAKIESINEEISKL